MASAEQKFNAAVLAIKNLPKNGPFQPSYEMMKKFYGLYKQATEGPCHEARPAFWNAIKKTKWEAWSSLGEMSKLDAQEGYVTEMLKVMVVNFKARDANHMVQIIETMPQTEEVRNFLQVMGPFFELVTVPDGGKKTPNGGIPNGDVPHMQNGDDPHLQNGDVHDLTEGDLGDGGTVLPVDILPNGHVPKQDLDAEEDVEETTPAVETEDAPPADTSHLIYANEEQNDEQSNSEDSASSSTEDEFLDTLDEPDVSMERRVRFADTEPLATMSEDQPLTSSPLVGDRITTEAEIHGIPGNTRTSYAVQRHLPLKHAAGRGAGDAVCSSEDTPENIALILERLQRDMNSVIARLNSLETNTLTQGADDTPDWPVSERRGTWWPFGELNVPTVLFIILWPLIVNWTLRLLRRRRLPRS